MTTLQKTFALLLGVVVLVLIYFLKPILAPFFAGMIVAYLGDPLVDRLEEFRVHRAIGVLLVFLAFGTILGAAIFVILPLLVSSKVRTGTVYVPKGAWLRNSPTGQTINALVPGHKADIAGGACYNDATVDIEAAELTQ